MESLLLMSTANYPFGKFREVCREIRKVLRRDTVLVANIGDLTRNQAQQLKDTGFAGIYHAVRMGQGHDTVISPQTRIRTFKNANVNALNQH